jgi:ATP-binding cassette subfamily F protein 3
MSLVRLAGVVREIGTFVILDRIDAAIGAGERVGLVGPNGAGKTTLLRIVAGLDEPDRGEVTRKRALSIGFLRQETSLDATFAEAPDLRTAVRRGAGELERLERELAELEAAGGVLDPRYADLQHRFDAHGGYSLDQRVDATLGGLGFPRAMWDRPPTALSGGEQTRAALARLLISDPDLLLLDEPTNHLDISALEWLEEEMRRRSGALLVASHDRAFLDGTVGRIWELRDRRLAAFRGGYSAYARQREERDARTRREADARDDEIAREQQLIQRYRSQRKHGKMHEHEARLERLDRIETPRAGRSLKLSDRAFLGGGPTRSAEVVVRAEGLVVGRLVDGARVEVATIPFLEARRGDRIGIVGPNGAGKTTLLKTIAGELPPLDGRLAVGSGSAIGYLSQLRSAAIPGATVLDALLAEVPLPAGEARGYLARFLFRGDDVLKEVASLSGGERSRLELALLGVLPSNVLLLDEPTNHLDIPAREALESFLRETGATVLLVSHDRRLLEIVCDRIWVVDDHLGVPFEGGFRAWRAAVAEGWTVEEAAARERARLHGGGVALGSTFRARGDAGAGAAVEVSAAVAAAGGDGHGRAHRHDGPRGQARGASGGAGDDPSAGPATAPGPGTGDGAARPPRPAVPRLSKDAYRRRKAVVEADLQRLEERKSLLEAALADPEVQANFVELRRIGNELADVDGALAAAEEAWLLVEEAAP